MEPPADADAILASVAEAGPGPEATSTQDARDSAQKLAELGRARVEGGEAEARARVEFARQLRDSRWFGLAHRIARAVDAPSGFGERLVQFWSDHFTVRADGAGAQRLALAFVDEAIRPHLNGRFEDLLFAADTHPMMLLYLDQHVSVGPNSRMARQNEARGLNENLAREILELHTLGVGADYSQADVRQLAKLLTGLTYNTRNDVTFRPGMAEPGAETVLGQSYGGDHQANIDDIRAVMVDIARHPATARHVSRKLAVHFVSDDPDDGLVAAMVAAWRRSDGHLPQVCHAMITHPALADGFRQKARQPFDYLAACLRGLGMRGDELRALQRPEINRFLYLPLGQMGQKWGEPAGPNGWPEEVGAWITPQLLAARISWATRVPAHLFDPLPDPRELMRATLRGSRSEALARAVPRAESAREGVALVLASTDFNRR